MKVIALAYYDYDDTFYDFATYSPLAVRRFMKKAHCYWGDDKKLFFSKVREALQKEGEVIGFSTYEIQVMEVDKFHFSSSYDSESRFIQRIDNEKV